jgi:hypothetical protein
MHVSPHFQQMNWQMHLCLHVACHNQTNHYHKLTKHRHKLTNHHRVPITTARQRRLTLGY